MSLNLLPEGKIILKTNINALYPIWNNGDNITRAFLRNMLLSDEQYLATSNENRKKLLPIFFLPVYITTGIFGTRLHTPNTISAINNFNVGVALNDNIEINYLIDALVRLEIRDSSYFEYMNKDKLNEFVKNTDYPFLEPESDIKNILTWLETSYDNRFLIQTLSKVLKERGLFYKF